MTEQGIWPGTTARLVVRRGRASDADEIWPWRQDDELNRWLMSIPTTAEENSERWTAGLEHNYVAEMNGVVVATGKVAPEKAWAQAEVADRARGVQVEVGWIVGPAFQGQGIGTEFARVLLDIAFAEGARRVTAYCFASNVASARMMEKLGMRQEGTSGRIRCIAQVSGWTPSSTRSWTQTPAERGMSGNESAIALSGSRQAPSGGAPVCAEPFRWSIPMPTSLQHTRATSRAPTIDRAIPRQRSPALPSR